MSESIYEKLNAIFEWWELESGDPDDIMDALNEAYLVGASHGGMDSEVFNHALEFVSKLERPS